MFKFRQESGNGAAAEIFAFEPQGGGGRTATLQGKCKCKCFWHNQHTFSAGEGYMYIEENNLINNYRKEGCV